MRGGEHLRERDEVEEDGGDGGGNGEVTPAGSVVQGRGQDREGGYAVEKDRDSEPEERHWANCQYIGVASVLPSRYSHVFELHWVA